MGERKKDSKVIQMSDIHEKAVVSPNAKIGKNVEIGPYTVIGDNVEIGEGTTIGPHVVVEGWTIIGKNNKIYHGASIGEDPQNIQYDGEKTHLFIGDDNTIRENVTIHRGTEEGGGETRIGSNNFIMAYCHVAHDCQLGNNIVMTNSATLGGHVTIEDNAVIAGLTTIKQYVRVGKTAMIGAHSKIVKDVPPYVLVDGSPARVNGINVIGLRRNGVKPKLRKEIKRAYKILYRSDFNFSEAVDKMDQELDASEEIEHFLRFLRNVQRGICR